MINRLGDIPRDEISISNICNLVAVLKVLEAPGWKLGDSAEGLYNLASSRNLWIS